ncbi:hypothetical protein JR316_0011842 [Psilocybe cubensis]|uniref:Uncharacterized protein n=2 Tax=Psilocybe cubensis TaxID=181762 RepID=A0ACB8GKR4_PSICU|nr:hypothetical protein JR316_0011842 [Psilocybe cubensis]KAH9476271.1 hypothetical protein JR316_0011842 [Psilocybe cubensis]
MLSFNFFVVLVICFLSQYSRYTKASLYPTKPISSTTYTAGQPAEVTWIEDGRKPFLNTTIGFKIDLYAGNKTYIATLSKDADPRSLFTTVYIPMSVPANFHHFNLRFITTQPPQIIYTADFNILANPYVAPPSPTSRNAVSSSKPVSIITVTSTVISRISGSQSGVLPSSTSKSSKGVPRMVRALKGRRLRTAHGYSERSFYFDLEMIKFRLVFMVWPAIVGFSMAF